jgi:hypothetical protein
MDMKFQILSLTGVLCPAIHAFGQCPTAKVLPHDGINATLEFGSSVALFGDSAVVGARLGDRAYYFERVSNQWMELQTIDPGLSNSNFGADVDLTDEWMVIGAPQFSFGPQYQNAGTAIVYQRQQSSWKPMQRLALSDKEPWDGFGYSVAIDGNRIVVGAVGDTGMSIASGAAYLYERNLQSGRWLLTETLWPSDGAPGDFAGESVAIDGDTIVVGAGLKNDLQTHSGAAYVFERIGGAWTQTAKLAGDGGSGDSFSLGAVDIWNDTIVIGARNNSPSPGKDYAGAAYVFRKGPPGWLKIQKLIAEDIATLDHFGSAVSLSPAGAVIGSRRDNWSNYGVSDVWGAAYHFRDVNGRWVQVGKMLAPDATSLECGLSIDSWNDEVLVGSWNDKEQCTAYPVCHTGAAYEFTLGLGAQQYCSCATQGPCANQDDHGGCRNSAGQGAVFQACGSSSVTTDDLKLESRWMPKKVVGLVIMGPRPDETPYGDGILCIGAGDKGLFRFPAGNSGPEGVITLGPGIVAHTHANFPAAGQIKAGDTWYFQAWFRDPNGPCGSGFNLSNGLKVEFTQ